MHTFFLPRPSGERAGVRGCTRHGVLSRLVTHFPADGRSGNELPDKPVVL